MPRLVFLIYDYVITLGREVDAFWPAKLTGAYALFFVNRYVTLIWNMMGLAQLGKFSDEVRHIELITEIQSCSCPAEVMYISRVSYRVLVTEGAGQLPYVLQSVVWSLLLPVYHMGQYVFDPHEVLVAVAHDYR